MKNFIFCLFTVMIGFFLSCSKQQDYSLIPVESGNKWGYVDHKGAYVINPQFGDAGFFYDGLAIVESLEGKIGYIDKKGKYIIAPTYKNGTLFCEGLAFVVSDGGHPMCIDKKGNVVFVFKEAERVWAFSEGLALFCNNEDKYGFVDKTGKITINPQFEAAGPFFEGLASVAQNEKYGFINKEGIIVINPQFEDVQMFHEGKAAIYDGKKWGFIDTKGAYVINPQFDGAFSFYGGLALVKQGNIKGYINTKGEFEINPQFDDAFIFINGLAPVMQGKTWGFINNKGKFEINPQFEDVYFFYGNIAPVKSADKWGFVNKKGKYVINPQFESVKIPYKEVWSISGNLLPSVESDYYDTDEFIGLFFQKYSDSKFDEVNASTTLKELTDHKSYGDNIKANDEYFAECYVNKEVVKDISINKVLFHFSNPIYKYVDTYSYYWGYSYKSGTQKEYKFSEKLYAIEYKFSLSGKAYGKNSAIANAIKTEIELHLNKTMEIAKERYYLYQEGEGFSFVIDYSDYNSVHLIVAFNENDLKNLMGEGDDSDYDYD